MQTGLLVFTDFVGIVAFALAGILAAEGKNVDPVGVFVMAFTTLKVTFWSHVSPEAGVTSAAGTA